MRLPRKEKKKIRAILICHIGNPELRKTKISKEMWIRQKEFYDVWFNTFNMEDIRSANKVKTKN